MDLSILEHLIPNIARWLNIQPATLLLYIGLIMTTANFAGRMIPDTAVGWLGVVRRICKFIGVYAQNRVAPGITHAAVIKDIIGQQAEGAAKDKIRDLASEMDALIPEIVDEVPAAARDIARGAASNARARLERELDPNPNK